MKAINIEAKVEKLDEVLSFIDSELKAAECPMKFQMKLDIAVEEIFVNIASYAYGDGVGQAEVIVDTDAENAKAFITFKDSGQKYNPLEHEDPDISLAAEDRDIGGLGIFLVKKTMDDLSYEYSDGKNILTMTYSWG